MVSVRSGRLLANVMDLLSERTFSETQIKNIIPRLHEQHFHQPEALAKIIDTWNIIMRNASVKSMHYQEDKFGSNVTPPIAAPPKSSLLGCSVLPIDMKTILADIEPDLLLLDPEKLIQRHAKVQGLGYAKNLGEHWTLLYNSPRGFYLQDWCELTKKLYYIEHNILNFMYDKKELKEMEVHPVVKSASVVEADFDHIRTRYLFADRSGYKSLSHMFSVQTALDRPILRDLVSSDTRFFLKKFAPFCTTEEYNVFSNLIKKYAIDEDDAEIFEKLAELNSLS